MEKQPNIKPQPGRQRVVRREVRRYACGCSTTRIEVYSLAEAPKGCQAHQGALCSESVTLEFESSDDLTKA